MANHLHSILTHWYSRKDECQWVLGSVIHIEGSNYRKTGAMILINEFGQYYGLISGGCLEKSLLMDVKKVLTYSRPIKVCYDSSEGSDIQWAAALGCGGKVTILLQPINANNQYQQLDQVYLALNNHQPVHYAVSVSENYNERDNSFHNKIVSIKSENLALAAEPRLGDKNQFLIIPLRPQTHLLIVGGGVDAIPLVQMAHVLGWRITLVDHRVGYATTSHFSHATIIHSSIDSAEIDDVLNSVDAAIVMTHNIAFDARALIRLSHFPIAYVGLLGPEHRKQKVLKQAGVDLSSLTIYGPMGFDLGGDLPESIALATLAQCHQVLEQKACMENDSTLNLKQYA